MIRRILIVAAFLATLAAAASAATPAQATCKGGQISVKPLVIELPECYPPGGGPV